MLYYNIDIIYFGHAVVSPFPNTSVDENVYSYVQCPYSINYKIIQTHFTPYNEI